MINAMSDDRERLLNGEWIVSNVVEDEISTSPGPRSPF